MKDRRARKIPQRRQKACIDAAAEVLRVPCEPAADAVASLQAQPTFPRDAGRAPAPGTSPIPELASQDVEKTHAARSVKKLDLGLCCAKKRESTQYLVASIQCQKCCNYG